MNSSLFYPKMAFTNLKKNRTTYFPYIVTSVFSVIILYTILTIYFNPGLYQMKGATSMLVLFSVGAVVIGIFDAVILLYANSFLIKRRKKELGLYSVLGLEKRHTAKILFFEMLYVGAFSILAGLVIGTLIGKLLFLLLLNLTGIPVTVTFSISGTAIAITALVFAGIFVLAFITNVFRVQMSNPVALLKGGQQGEKEPKASWFLTIFGLATLGSAYYMAVKVKTPSDALGIFLIAVLLVIAGTYALFTSGSIALLKMLKRNKTFYYKAKNFISVSGMIYRMKQNAVGLSSICILSTMVLVTISCTVSLYLGQKDSLVSEFPLDAHTIIYNKTVDEQELDVLLDNLADEYHVAVSDMIHYRSRAFAAIRDGNAFMTQEQADKTLDYDYDTAEHSAAMVVLTLDDYNRMENDSKTLDDGQILLYTSSGYFDKDTVFLEGEEYLVKRELQNLTIAPKVKAEAYMTYYIIVKDEAARDEIYKSFSGEEEGSEGEQPRFETWFNLSGEEEDIREFLNVMGSEAFSTVVDNHNEDGSYRMYDQDVYNAQDDWYMIYGGFLFLGIFFGLLFISATVLIIYYKQISEGYDDRDRFEIMQKVGMDKKLVRGTIHKQILTVFFLPLVTAFVHMGFALSILPKVLYLFQLYNTSLIFICAALTALAFSLFYLVIYVLTARTYYNLVERKQGA